MNDEFSPSQFKEWLSKQDATRTFNYADTDACLLASFAKEQMGFENAVAGGSYYRSAPGCPEIPVPSSLADAVAIVACKFTVEQVRDELREQGADWALA